VTKETKGVLRRTRREAGVTLIEMLVVVTIIALFAALVAPKLMGRAEAAKVTAAKAQINSLMDALRIYKMDTSSFPTTEQGLQALRVKPENVANWNGPYLPKEIPNDPWGRAYAYKYPSEQGDEPEIMSLGADGQQGGDGTNADLYSWK
jgi:general secretion pathway protein G